jgi:hypothetical protein
MQPDDNESRSTSRFQSNLGGTIEADDRESECAVSNLSRTGALVAGKFPPPDSSEVWLTVRSPSGDLKLSLPCKITRTSIDPDNGVCSLGVEFLKIHDEDRPTLEALISRVVEGVSMAGLENLPDNATPQQIRKALETIPLPHRIQVASRGTPKEREIMMHDTNLQVVDALARNPSLLPHEVLAILRTRNILPHTLELIGKDPRWAGSEQVRIKVAAHRSTPPPVADSIISAMPQPMLKKLIRSPDLPAALRDKVLRKLPSGQR